VASTSTNPLVSVILPTHDRPQRLAGALTSVLGQTYRDLEILVVDDASSAPARDVVGAICRDDTRVRVIRLEANGGAAVARNTALRLADGDLVAFLDDDDRWEPQKVARQVEYLEANPDIGIVSCHYLIDHEGSGSRPQVFRGPWSLDADQVQWANFPGSFSFVMARRSALGDELWLDESFPSVEDWDLWLRCARRAGAGVVENVLVRQVFHDERRLSNPLSESRGLELFLGKHGPSLPAACRTFIAAHIRMERGQGWAKRRTVLSSLITSSPRVSTILAVEQIAKQLGRWRGDPGLVSRVLARMVGAGRRGEGDRDLRTRVDQQLTPS
jgi:glycosyltransferase involved in cell wall biosynthesis